MIGTLVFCRLTQKGPCGMTVNNDIDDDSATKHGDSHRSQKQTLRRGARVRGEDVNGIMHERRVPPHKLRPALWRAQQTRGALDVAVRRASSGGPKGCEFGVQGPEQWVEREGSDKHQRTIHQRRPWP